MTDATDINAPSEGTRERKRRETRQRIAEAGLKLFTAKGFEATTLDAVAAEAGISRRTVFHYFKSKDEILLSLQAGLGERLVAELSAQPRAQTPLDAARIALLAVIAPYSHDGLIEIDRLLRSSEGVQARKQASYLRDEGVLYDALRQQWPDESETRLRLVAMLSINVMRLSLNAWSADGGKRPLPEYVGEAFAELVAVFRD